ncbi:MAG: hypothetical protein LUC87_00805 [Clostridiales bacterium]|nr:hypothetical protein [Clostridiales bacterium]
MAHGMGCPFHGLLALMDCLNPHIAILILRVDLVMYLPSYRAAHCMGGGLPEPIAGGSDLFGGAVEAEPGTNRPTGCRLRL